MVEQLGEVLRDTGSNPVGGTKERKIMKDLKITVGFGEHSKQDCIFFVNEDTGNCCSYYPTPKKLYVLLNGRIVTNSGYNNIQEAREHAERILGVR